MYALIASYIKTRGTIQKLRFLCNFFLLLILQFALALKKRCKQECNSGYIQPVCAMRSVKAPIISRFIIVINSLFYMKNDKHKCKNYLTKLKKNIKESVYNISF